MDCNTSLDVKVKVANRTGRMCKCILYNDDTTWMEFVMLVLMEVFQKAADEAAVLTLQTHNSGTALIGRYPKKIAYEKQKTAMEYARQSGFDDFKVGVEED